MYNIILLYYTSNCDSVGDMSVGILQANVFCFVVHLQSMAQVSLTDRQWPVNEE